MSSFMWRNECLLRGGRVMGAVRQNVLPAVRGGVAGSSKATARNSALLDVASEEAVVYVPEDQDYLGELSDMTAVPNQFLEYQSASKQLSELEALSNELFMNLQEIGDMEPLVQQKVSEENQEALDLRRKRRAEARAARKSSTKSKPAPSPSATKTGTSKTVSSPDVLKQAVDCTIRKLNDSKDRLESLYELAGTPEPSPSVPEPAWAVPQVHAQTQPQANASTSAPSTQIPSLPPSLGGLALNGIVRDPVKPAEWARPKHKARSSRSARPAPGSEAGEVASKAAWKKMKKAMLTFEEEKELTLLVKDTLKLEKVKEEIAAVLKREPTMSEWARAVGMDDLTFRARKDAGDQAKRMMMEMNRRLVVAMSQKYQKLVPLADLVHTGMQGLIKGIEKFDETKGFRFSTYAHWWVRQAVTRVVSEQSRAIRLPGHLYSELVKIRKVFAEHKRKTGENPTTEQVGEELGLTPARVEYVMNLGKEVSSLDKPVGEEEGDSMLDALQDDRPDANLDLDQEMMRRELDSILVDLSEREANIIKLRFGLEGGQELSLEAVGQIYGITRERVRQIEAKVMRNLKAKKDVNMRFLQDFTGGKDMELAARSSQGLRKS